MCACVSAPIRVCMCTCNEDAQSKISMLYQLLKIEKPRMLYIKKARAFLAATIGKEGKNHSKSS